MNSVSGAVRARRDKPAIGLSRRRLRRLSDAAPHACSRSSPAAPPSTRSPTSGTSCLPGPVAAAQAFQGFDWNWHWCNHYLRRAEREDAASPSSPAGATAASSWCGRSSRARVAGLLQLTWMGDPVSQYGDILAEKSADALDAAARRLGAPPRRHQPRSRLAAARARGRDDRPAHRRAGCASPRSGAPPLTRAARTPRTALRRAIAGAMPPRRLAKLGDRHASSSRPAMPRPAPPASIAIGWKRGQLLERGTLSPAVADPRFAASSPTCSPIRRWSSACRAVALECDGTPAAASILVACKDYIAGHVVAFDPAFEKASVGMLLLEGIMAKAFSEGFAVLRPAGAGRRLQVAPGAQRDRRRSTGRCRCRARAASMRGSIWRVCAAR